MTTVRSLALTRRGGWCLLIAVICFVMAAALSLPALLDATGLLAGLVVLAVAYVLVAVGGGFMVLGRVLGPQRNR